MTETSTTTDTTPAVTVDQGEVLIDNGFGTVVVEYNHLTPLIDRLTEARDQLGDAR